MTLWERNGWGNDEMERLQEEWGARCELSEVCLPQVSSGSSQSGTGGDIRHTLPSFKCRTSAGALPYFRLDDCVIFASLAGHCPSFPTCMLGLGGGHVWYLYT
ncbi:hypothetical protein ACN42_g7944 [Penicillium freii]|uniref:Uncharacterized protein n=1 Tax=Penicillium freii TaxID=48697 RepID=A0A101MF13_PENFR|nr:hypothetical protein ACN42_g7944 [Penicillium freii]